MRKIGLLVALAICGTTDQCRAGGVSALPECNSDDFACQRIVEQIIRQRASSGGASSEGRDKSRHSTDTRSGAQSAPTADQLIAIHKMALSHKCKDKADWAGIYSAGRDRTIDDLLCRVEVLEERVRDLEDGVR